MSENNPVRFGIIGCGGAAMPMAQAISASAVAKVAAAYDLNPALTRDVAERFGADAHDTLESLLNDDAADAVYIAVPHNQLAPLATKALRAGKHALVEKPMALSLPEADALIALAEAKGLGLGVNFDLRQSAQAVQACGLVRAGAIGDIVAVRIQTFIDKPASYWQAGYSGRWVSSWRTSRAEAGGGVVLMNSSHQLDSVRFITGLEVASVSGEIGTLAAPVPMEVEDTASASLRYTNGAIGSLMAGAHLAGPEAGSENIQIYGTLGQLRVPSLYGDDPVTLFLRRPWSRSETGLYDHPTGGSETGLYDHPTGGSETRPYSEPVGGEPELAANEWHSLPHTPAHIYQGTVDAFARAVQRGEAPSPNGRDAREVLAIVLGLYRAAETRSVQRIEHLEVRHAGD
jgi:predicted dehydrogenase